MSKHKDADLILKLYDLRREATMREARNWFFSFNPTKVDDFMDVLMSDKSGYYRMVTSYWDMAASLVNNGAIDPQMFNEANGEHLFVYAKIEPFIEDLRREFNAPQALAHLEKLVKQVPNYEERLTAIRERMKEMAVRMAQRQAAAATAS
jgi:cysteinyl-tRNA synthetase